MDLPGSCYTTFARDECLAGQPRPNVEPSFHVAINPDYISKKKVAVQEVIISYTAGGVTTNVTLDQTVAQATIDGTPVDISSYTVSAYTVNGISITMLSEDIVRVELPNFVQIDFDFMKEIGMQVPADQQDQLCGICGDFDGDNTNDKIAGALDAGSQCPSQDTLGLTPGQNIQAADEDVLALSWFAGIDENDSHCLIDCGL